MLNKLSITDTHSLSGFQISVMVCYGFKLLSTDFYFGLFLRNNPHTKKQKEKISFSGVTEQFAESEDSK